MRVCASEILPNTQSKRGLHVTRQPNAEPALSRHSARHSPDRTLVSRSALLREPGLSRAKKKRVFHVLSPRCASSGDAVTSQWRPVVVTERARQITHAHLVLVQCWATVADGGPTLNQNRVIFLPRTFFLVGEASLL